MPKTHLTLGGFVCSPALSESEQNWFNLFFRTHHIVRTGTLSDLYHTQDSDLENDTQQSAPSYLEEFGLSPFLFQGKKLILDMSQNDPSSFLDIHEASKSLVQYLHHFFLPQGHVHRLSPELALNQREMKGILYIKMNVPGQFFSIEIRDDFIILNEYAMEYDIFTHGKKQKIILSGSMPECAQYKREISKQYDNIDIKVLKNTIPYICYRYSYCPTKLVSTALMYDELSHRLEKNKSTQVVRKI